MSIEKPVYILVGGVSHTPVFFEALIDALADQGFESHAVSYPTVGRHNTAGRTQQDEVKAIQDAVTDYIDGKKNDVVLVMHSYGGWPGSRAVKGLDKETRSAAGKKHGIIELVFLAAFLLPDNAPMAMYSYLPPWLTSENGERIPNEQSVPLLFSDLDTTTQAYWLSQFEPHRNDFTAETVPDAPWHLSIPKTYIISTKDQTATVQFQLGMLQGVMDETWSVKTISAGHEPFLSQPVNLAKVLLQPTF